MVVWGTNLAPGQSARSPANTKAVASAGGRGGVHSICANRGRPLPRTTLLPPPPLSGVFWGLSLEGALERKRLPRLQHLHPNLVPLHAKVGSAEVPAPPQGLSARALRSSSVQTRPSTPPPHPRHGARVPSRSAFLATLVFGGVLIADESASHSDALCRLQRGPGRLQLETRGAAWAASRAAAGRACAVPVRPHEALGEWRIGTSLANGDSTTALRETSVVRDPSPHRWCPPNARRVRRD